MRSLCSFFACSLLFGCSAASLGPPQEARVAVHDQPLLTAQTNVGLSIASELPIEPAELNQAFVPGSALPEAPSLPLPPMLFCDVSVKRPLSVGASLGATAYSETIAQAVLGSRTRVFVLHLHEPTDYWRELHR